MEITINQTANLTQKSYAQNTAAARIAPYGAAFATGEYSQTKACHCGPEAPCKKDGICRCKLALKFREKNLETALVGVEN